MIVELIVSAALLLGPPIAAGPEEGPAAPDDVDDPGDPDDPDDDLDAPDDPELEPDGSELDPVDPELEPDPEPEPEPVDEEVAAIVEAAAYAAADRAVLERNNREVPEFVTHLDALAPIEDKLDTCGKAVQAELRMDLALAYLRAADTCNDGTEHADEAARAEAEQAIAALEYPRECGATTNPKDCAGYLLERAAEFGDAGPAGAEDPLAQASGCPHAADSMSVEQMFGTCVAEEYGAAVERWRASESAPVDDNRSGLPLDVPRWGSILGISLGVGAIAAGVTLVAIDGNCPGGGDPMMDIGECPNVYNTNGGGAVLISVGALAVISMGAILTITELRNKKRARPTAMRRRMQRVQAVTGWRVPSLQLRPRLRH